MSPGSAGSSGFVTVRLFLWIGLSVGLSALTSPNFIPLLSQALLGTFDSVFPAIPFAALLSIIFLLRWEEFKGILLKERGTSLRSEISTRLLGAATLFSTFIVVRFFFDQSLYASAVGVILTFYGASLILNPRTREFLLPYAAVYAMGVAAPAILQWAVGEPLAEFSSVLASSMVAAVGIPANWQGTQFALLSKTGESVAAVVTPGCSSIISITTFLGLLTLIHIDMRRDFSSTVKIAAMGIVALLVLNAVRISVLVWVSFVYGEAGLASAHNWIGYAIFLGFYLVVLASIARKGQNGRMQVRFQSRLSR